MEAAAKREAFSTIVFVTVCLCFQSSDSKLQWGKAQPAYQQPQKALRLKGDWEQYGKAAGKTEFSSRSLNNPILPAWSTGRQFDEFVQDFNDWELFWQLAPVFRETRKEQLRKSESGFKISYGIGSASRTFMNQARFPDARMADFLLLKNASKN